MMQQKFEEAAFLLDSDDVKNSSLVDRVSLNQAFEVINAVRKVN